MSYSPEVLKCKMNFKNITDDEIRKYCIDDKEVSGVRKFYEKLDGIELYLSLWDYDNHEDYHLSGWAEDVDEMVKEAFWIYEQEFGFCKNKSDFKSIWEAGEYDCGVSIIFNLNNAEVLEVISKEKK